MATKEAKLQIIVDAQNRANSTFAALGRNLDATSKRTADMRNGMMAVGAAGASAFAGLAFLTNGIVSAGADFEQTNIAFETMIGNADEAQKVLADISAFAAKTPFQLPEIEAASKQLLAYGTATKDLIPTMTMLGDVSAGLNVPLGDMTYLYGTLQTQGRAFSKDIHQFTARGIPIIAELARVLGVSKGEVMGLVEEGKVGFPQVQQAFQNMTGEGGKFFNLMENQSSSLGGMWSNFKDVLEQNARVIGEQLVPVLKPMVEQLIAIANAVGQFATEHPKLAAFILMATLGFTAILALLVPIAMVLPGIIAMWGALSAVTLAGVATFGLVIAILGALGLAMMNVYNITTLLTNHWDDIWLGIKLTVADAANAVIDTVEGMINFIIEGVNTAIRAINKVIAAAQKVPGFGKSLSKIGELKTIDLGGIDTDTIAANDLAGRSNPVNVGSHIVNFIGGNYLSETVAEQIGDMILGKLKLSNPF